MVRAVPPALTSPVPSKGHRNYNQTVGDLDLRRDHRRNWKKKYAPASTRARLQLRDSPRPSLRANEPPSLKVRGKTATSSCMSYPAFT